MSSNSPSEDKRNDPESNKNSIVKPFAVDAITSNDGFIGSGSEESSYKDLGYMAFIPISCITLSAGLTLIPQHSLIDQPEYWYELSIPLTMSFLSTYMVLAILRFKVFFKEVPSLTSVKTCVKLFLFNWGVIHANMLLTHLFWTNFLGYQYPIPWAWAIIIIPWVQFGLLPSTYYAFPPEYRKEATKKILAFLMYIYVFKGACIERLVAMYLFMMTPDSIQPIWAILLPLWRESMYFILDKLRSKSCDDDNKETSRETTLVTFMEHNSNYAAFLAISLGLLASDLTCYCMLGVELLLKLYTCYGIVKTHKRIESETTDREALQLEKNEAIDDLLLDEFLEVVMSVVYSMITVIAFYGPNSAILGNVGAEMWEWQRISSLVGLLTALSRMFVMDMIAFLMNALILWKFCSVNTLKELSRLMKKYWPFISVTLGGAVQKVCLVKKNNFPYTL